VRLGVACAVVLTAGSAGADPAPLGPIAIEYVAPAVCPDEISLRAGVIARLGQDPFRGDAPRRALIDVAQTAAGFVAAIELHEPGQPASRRAVGPAQRCEDAVDALELALAVIIDPTRGAEPPPKPVVTSPPPPPRLPSGPGRYEPPGWREAARPPAPPRYELGVSVGSLAGAMPESSVTLGIRAGYAIDERWRAGVYARYGRGHGDLDPAHVRTYEIGIAELHAEGCLKQMLLIACAFAGVGSKSVTIERDDGMFVVTTVADYSDPYFVVGASVALDLPLGGGFLRPSLDALIPLPAVAIESEGASRYDVPFGELGFDLALGYRW
jgi:hypothetical protein